MSEAKLTQAELILRYFQSHPDRDIPHAEVVDWATQEYKRLLGGDETFRDPDRAIRKLSQQGKLHKIKTGVYRYAGSHQRIKALESFDSATKIIVLQRDGHRCVVCGRGVNDGVALQVDHLIPMDKGGPATVENGQTLCAQHNFQKKNYNCTEFGNRLFERLRATAVGAGDTKMIAFCDDVLDVFRRHKMR